MERFITCESHIRPWCPAPWKAGPFTSVDETRDAINEHLHESAGVSQHVGEGAVTETMMFTCVITIVNTRT
jgi:hypothetical protein